MKIEKLCNFIKKIILFIVYGALKPENQFKSADISSLFYLLMLEIKIRENLIPEKSFVLKEALVNDKKSLIPIA
ncbi:hypothetical protein [Persicobacter diffluens]|uniref:hypothetical protein n=1 Tax=Persicobacter diffluens TaxID=981 RepID=UPI0030C76A3D